jgi:hypothetical protein
MALRGRRIENFDDISLGACSQGLPISISSTSFQKSTLCWPQQPLTEKVLKFNLINHGSTPQNFFSKSYNKAESKNLDDSEVLSSDFQALESLQPQDLNSLINLNGLNDLDSLISSKSLLILMLGSFPSPK